MKYFGCVCLALAVISTSGCGSKSDFATVSGKVTIDGEPIGSGSIQFISADGATPTGGGTIKDGEYTAQVPPGDKVVLVVGSKVVGQEPLYKEMPDSPMREKLETLTPEAYNAAHLTPLKATITDSQEGLDFTLSKSFKAR